MSCFRHLFISQGQEAEARKELLKLRATVEEVDREIKEMAAEKMVSSQFCWYGTVLLVILCVFYFNKEQCCGGSGSKLDPYRYLPVFNNFVNPDPSSEYELDQDPHR